jgi:hypothetical protein
MEFPKIIEDAKYHLHGYRNYLEMAVEESASTSQYETWAEIALDHRDDIEKMLEELTDLQKEELAQSDNYLREHQGIFSGCDQILARLHSDNPPKEYWWWYLANK